MIRRYDIVGILKRVISEMIIPFKVKTSVDNNDGTFTIETCNTQYLNECSIISVNDRDYTVVSIENNTNVTLMGTPVLTEDFELRPPLFIPDTPQGANNELYKLKSDLNRYPFIWLLENFPTTYLDDGSHNVAESRVRLFFLNATQDGKWLEDEHRKFCIEPMINLCDLFLRELELKVSGKLERFVITNRIRFGNSNGENKILDEYLSGVELDIELPVRKWSVTCNECY